MSMFQSAAREAYRGIATSRMPPAPAGAVSVADFRGLYRSCTQDVLRFLGSEMQAEIAAHNAGWSAEKTDFPAYLEASWIRYYRIYLRLAASPQLRSVCDVGGFWGAFPIVLRELGYDVTMTETLEFYSDTFNGLFDHIRSRGVKIIDHDPFDKDAPPPGSFDLVTVMAVLEHYPHSLATFMENMRGLLSRSGMLYLEVPNVAFWSKRVGLLLGRTPLAPVGDIFASRVPFIGHHHEFTLRELRELADLSGFAVVAEETFNYSPRFELSPANFFRYPIRSTAFLLRPDCRELLGIVCRRADDPPGD